MDDVDIRVHHSCIDELGTIFAGAARAGVDVAETMDNGASAIDGPAQVLAAYGAAGPRFVQHAVRWCVRNEDIGRIGNQIPFSLAIGVAQEIGPAGKIRQPRSTVELDPLYIVDRIDQVDCIAKNRFARLM